MKNISIKILNLLNTFGLSPKQFFQAFRGIPYFFKNRRELREQLNKEDTPFRITRYYPCLYDRFDTAGNFPLHYFYQDLYVAQRLYKNNPVKHIDIGSRIDGFITHVASFREIEVIDIRDIVNSIPNVLFIKADLMSDDFNLTDYCDSVSCLHAIEHFGLGRYGDPIDVNGHVKGIKNIIRMLKNGGRFYFSTLIGPQRIEFDAHRVFSLKYLIELLKNDFLIEGFSYIDDENNFHNSPELSDNNIMNNFYCNYGCGIFELVKK